MKRRANRRISEHPTAKEKALALLALAALWLAVVLTCAAFTKGA